MSTPNLEVPAVEPVAPVVAAPEVPAPAPVEQKRYTYQPKDKEGRPIGGVQVILYTTEEELRDKLVNQNIELVQKLRQVTKEQRLGTHVEEIPADAERFTNIVEFKPRTLSAQERFELSQKLNDPEKFDEARDQLLESAVGVPPSQLAKNLNEQQLYILQMRARENYRDFLEVPNSGYHNSPENRQLLTDWMFKNELAPTVKNFLYASSKLKEAGLLFEAPVVQQADPASPAPAAPVAPVAPAPVVKEPNPQVPAVPESRITPPVEPQAKRHSHVPSGLNDRVSSNSGANSLAPLGPSVTLADIDKMPADQYKLRMKDPEFAKLVNKLYDEADARRRARVNA